MCILLIVDRVTQQMRVWSIFQSLNKGMPYNILKFNSLALLHSTNIDFNSTFTLITFKYSIISIRTPLIS